MRSLNLVNYLIKKLINQSLYLLVAVSSSYGLNEAASHEGAIKGCGVGRRVEGGRVQVAPDGNDHLCGAVQRWRAQISRLNNELLPHE